MALSDVVFTSFVDELEKIALAHGRSMVSKTRTGTRPISVDKLIAKHNAGTLLKKKADASGSIEDVRGSGADDPGGAKPPKHKGDVPTRGDQIPWEAKLGAIRGGDTVSFSGEWPNSGPETPKARLPGEVPTQAPAQGSVAPPASGTGLRVPVQGRLRAPAITNDQSAKKTRKGDGPTQDRDMNMIDRGDLRESATTVTGLAQNSNNIGAFNSPAEHS